MLENGITKNLDRVFDIVKKPEHFLLEKYYGLKVPKGFRIELFAARQLELIYSNTRQLRLRFLKTEDCWSGSKKVISIIRVRKLKDVILSHKLTRPPKKLFCPYCEKLVIPKKLHKLDFGDFILFLFTAGFWAIFLFAIFLFVRRCPVCNYSLRGFKPLSKEDRPTGN